MQAGTRGKNALGNQTYWGHFRESLNASSDPINNPWDYQFKVDPEAMQLNILHFNFLLDF